MFENITGWLVLMGLAGLSFLVWKLVKSGALKRSSHEAPAEAHAPAPAPVVVHHVDAGHGHGHGPAKRSSWLSKVFWGLVLIIAIGGSIIHFVNVEFLEGSMGLGRFFESGPQRVRQRAPAVPSFPVTASPDQEPADREAVEAVVHDVGLVPVEPARTPRRRLPEGYEALPTPDLTAGLVRMYCSDTRTGPERPWHPDSRCIGGWVSFSSAEQPWDVTYQLSWVGR